MGTAPPIFVFPKPGSKRADASQRSKSARPRPPPGFPLRDRGKRPSRPAASRPVAPRSPDPLHQKPYQDRAETRPDNPSPRPRGWRTCGASNRVRRREALTSRSAAERPTHSSRSNLSSGSLSPQRIEGSTPHPTTGGELHRKNNTTLTPPHRGGRTSPEEPRRPRRRKPPLRFNPLARDDSFVPRSETLGRSIPRIRVESAAAPRATIRPRSFRRRHLGSCLPSSWDALGPRDRG